jgi:hypothetical protein
MEQSVEKIIERNLLEVFNVKDAGSRRAVVDELWDKDGCPALIKGRRKVKAFTNDRLGERLLEARNTQAPVERANRSSSVRFVSEWSATNRLP